MTAQGGYDESVVHFSCAGEPLIGILATPAPPSQTPAPTVGVVIVVGGPQYRVGSHRQFVMLARALAAAGVACLRFDARGMGDSAGSVRLFTELKADISAAVDALRSAAPSVERVALWGLCDGASAALIAVAGGLHVQTLILVNPWVQTGEVSGAARGRSLWRYYRARLSSAGFWRGVWRRITGSGRVGGHDADQQHNGADSFENIAADGAPMPVPDGDFVREMQAGLAAFDGDTYLVLSGRDLTADAFRERVRRDRALRRALKRTLRASLRLPEADHTFSSTSARCEMEQACITWLRAT